MATNFSDQQPLHCCPSHNHQRVNSGDLPRRDLLRGLALTAVAAMLPEGLRAQTKPGNAGRIDFHHHFGSPRWIAKLIETKSQGWQPFQHWTPEKSLEAMDKAGVSTAMISCTAPGPRFPGMSVDDARSMTRDMNEYGAKLVSDYKGRFGLLATLYVPDIDNSLKEIEYALDTLKADGVGLITSYGNTWLGDASYKPVFDELNRRKALVYTHPTVAPCCTDLMPNVSPIVVEFNTDTSRAIANILINGQAGRTPEIKYVFSHAGGTAPYLVQRLRIAPVTKLADALAGTPAPNSRLFHLRRFYYDVAQSQNPLDMHALKLFAGMSQIVFGSDFPYTVIADDVEALQKCGFTPAELEAVDRGNALRLVPQYRV